MILDGREDIFNYMLDTFSIERKCYCVKAILVLSAMNDWCKYLQLTVFGLEFTLEYTFLYQNFYALYIILCAITSALKSS